MQNARLMVDRLEPRHSPARFGLPATVNDLATNYPATDTRSLDVTVGDFNGDKIPDIASIRLDGDATVYLNNGHGVFTAKTLLASGVSNGPFGTTLAAGDFNGDGRTDLALFAAAAGVSGQQLRVYPGNGDGTFGSASVVTGVTGAYTLRVADLNRDGKDDLIASSDTGGVSVLLGQSGGGLAAPVVYPTGQILGLDVGDLNRDGLPDVVTVCFPDGQLAVRLGTGGGALGPITTFPALTIAQAGNGFYSGVGAVGLGDFTGDGNQDAVVTGYTPQGKVILLLRGQGDGSFAAPTSVASGLIAYSGPVVADINSDGHLDVFFSNYPVASDPSTSSARGLAILLGDGAGGFTQVDENIGNSSIVDGIASADFNRDGRPDVVGASLHGLKVALAGIPVTLAVGGPAGQVQRYLENGDTTGSPITPIPGYTGTVRVSSADVTGDGVADLIAATGPGLAGRVVILDGKTDATLSSFSPFEAAFTGGVFVTAADMNGDGKAEVVVTPDQGGGPVVAVYDGAGLATGGGSAAQILRFYGIDDPNFRGGARAAIGDLNGDGQADLIAAAGFGGGPRIALFDGASVRSNRTPVRLVGDFFVFEQTLRNGVFVTSGDLTGDGAAELVVGGGPGGGPRVMVLDGKALVVGGNQRVVANFFASDPSSRGGVRVAFRSGTGGLPLLLAGSGESEAATARVYSTGASQAGIDDMTLSPFSGSTLTDGVFVG